MKKILSVFMCLFAFDVIAQTAPEELFDLTNENIFGEETEQIFTGKPIVLIEYNREPQKQINKAEQLPPPDLKQNTLNIPIKTFFGHDRTAAFVDHTTDFLTIAQILDNETVRITEQVQFITTKDGEKFKRFIPTQIIGKNGEKTSFKTEFLSLKQDQSFVPFEMNTVSQGVEITLDTPLPKGVHKMTLEYLIFNPFKINRSLAEIFLPITGPSWEQMTERLTTVVMMPKKSRFYEKDLLFGTNNQKIPDNTKISEDEKGVLIFQNTHPLPAYADVRIHLVLDAQDLPMTSGKENYNFKILEIFALVLLGYAMLSILTARLKKWKRPLAESKKINPILWATEIGENINNYQTDLIKESPVRFAGLGEKWKKILSFLRFNWEYMFGVILLILATKYTALYYNLEITVGMYGSLLFLALATIFLIDYCGTRVQFNHLADVVKNTLLNDPQGLNLAKREISTYYQIAICLGFHEIWKKRLIANNPSYKDLTCFKKEK